MSIQISPPPSVLRRESEARELELRARQDAEIKKIDTLAGILYRRENNPDRHIGVERE